MAYFGFTNKLVKGETIKIFNYGNCKRDFKEDRNIEIVAAALNITLSIIGAKTIGMTGVLVGTVVSQLWFWLGRSYVVFKRCLNENKWKYAKYWFVNFIDLSATIVGVEICVYLKKLLPIENIYLKFIASGIVCEMIVIAVFMISHFNNSDIRKILKFTGSKVKERI